MTFATRNDVDEPELTSSSESSCEDEDLDREEWREKQEVIGNQYIYSIS